MKEKPVCSKCKSEDILFTDAKVSWFAPRQEFEVDDAGPEYFCKNCLITSHFPDWIEYE